MLRPSIAGVGPIIDDIQDGLGLPSAAVSLLTALPLLCFGLGSFIVAGARPPARASIAASALVLGLLAVALLIRTLDGPGLLFTGTVLSGAGDRGDERAAAPAGQAGLPDAGRSGHRPLHRRCSAAAPSVAALIAVPLEIVDRPRLAGSLFVWGIVGVFAFAIWTPQVARRSARARSPTAGRGRCGRAGAAAQSVALALTAFMGLQSISFYVCLAWLPSLLHDAGYSTTAAGRLPLAAHGARASRCRCSSRPWPPAGRTRCVYAVGFSRHRLARLPRPAARARAPPPTSG